MDIQSIVTFMEIVQSPEKFQAYVKTLQDENARLVAAIETVGKVSEIDTLVKRASAREEAARTIIDKATADAQAMRAAATADADAQKADIAVQRQKLKEDQKALKAKQKDLDAAWVEYQKSADDLAQQVQRTSDLQASLVIQQVELTERLEKLRSVMGG